jgi:hypothetical protein
VGPAAGKSWGAHITICESVDFENGEVHSIEGNARGVGPDGERYEGVVKQTRKLTGDGLPAKQYRVMHVVRPLAPDFT